MEHTQLIVPRLGFAVHSFLSCLAQRHTNTTKKLLSTAALKVFCSFCCPLFRVKDSRIENTVSLKCYRSEARLCAVFPCWHFQKWATATRKRKSKSSKGSNIQGVLPLNSQLSASDSLVLYCSRLYSPEDVNYAIFTDWLSMQSAEPIGSFRSNLHTCICV